ncbi:MAG: putative aminohydrolase SsnA [Planctomycetota bacterium]|nr:putative aminohydrolase SsnA [Planctomycetota bacterium]
MTLILENASLVTFDKDQRVFQKGFLVADDQGVIVSLGEGDYQGAEKGTRLDARGRMVIPGLINAHHHLYSTLARGFGPIGPARNFPEILENLWWPLDRALCLEDIRVSARIGLLASLKAGVTTVIDHHASESSIEGSLDEIADAGERLGIRVATCFEVTDRDGADVAKRGIEENIRFAKRCKDRGRVLGGAPGTAAMFGLHASFTVGEETLAASVDAAKSVGLTGFHVHVAEDKSDVTLSNEKYGQGPVTRLINAGALGAGSIAVHCIHLEESDRKALADKGVFVVHNPSSNMNNAVGRGEIGALLKSGVLVGLGSDGMNADIQRELATAYLLLRHAHSDPTLGGEELTSLFIKGNQTIADSLFPGARAGRLEIGGSADFAILDLHPYTPLNSGNALFHMIYGDLGGRVATVVAGGKVLVEERQLKIDIDEEQLYRHGQVTAEQLWKRIQA